MRLSPTNYRFLGVLGGVAEHYDHSSFNLRFWYLLVLLACLTVVPPPAAALWVGLYFLLYVCMED